jgi:hypothetical protein
MARIKTLSEEQAREALARLGAPDEGFVRGIRRIVLVDAQIGGPVGQLYRYLNFRPDSRLTRLQREMVATVVNGTIGGRP